MPRPGSTPKAPAARRVAGTPAPRLDLPDKVFGRPRFVHDLALPGLLHGRVLKPRVAGRQADRRSTKRARAGIAGRHRRGARRQLRRGRRRDRGRGGGRARRPAQGRGVERRRRAARRDASSPPGSRASLPRPPPSTSARQRRRRQVARTIRRQYTRPFIAHASMAPSCAIAQWTGADKVQVWSHCQGVYNLRADLALALRPAAREHRRGARRGRRLLRPQRRRRRGVRRRAAGARCRRAPGARAMVARGRARLVAGRRRAWPSRSRPISTRGGEIVGWRGDVWSNGHVSRPGRSPTPTVLAASQIAKPFERFIAFNPPMANGGGAERNAVPLYDFPACDITCHRLLTMPIRTSALRTLGRLRQRVRHRVLHGRAGGRARRGPAGLPPAPPQGPARPRRAGGRRQARRLERVAQARRRRPRHRLRRATRTSAPTAPWWRRSRARPTSACAGWWWRSTSARSSIPDGVANQIEGGAIQATSWTLKEAVRFDRTRITSDTLGDLSHPALLRGARRRGRDPHPPRGESRWAPARPRTRRRRRPSATPCSMRSACACAICRSRASASSRRWVEGEPMQLSASERRRGAGAGGGARGAVQGRDRLRDRRHASAPSAPCATSCWPDAPADLLILTRP